MFSHFCHIIIVKLNDYSVQNDSITVWATQECGMLRETAPNEVSLEAAMEERQ